MGKYRFPFNENYGISSDYGIRKSPFTGKSEEHDGVDIRTPIGKVGRFPFKKQIVIRNGTDKKAGNVRYCAVQDVETGLVAWFFHIQECFVPVGYVGYEGGRLFVTGATGKVTGPHTHFRVTRTTNIKTHVDPKKYFSMKAPVKRVAPKPQEPVNKPLPTVPEPTKDTDSIISDLRKDLALARSDKDSCMILHADERKKVRDLEMQLQGYRQDMEEKTRMIHTLKEQITQQQEHIVWLKSKSDMLVVSFVKKIYDFIKKKIWHT